MKLNELFLVDDFDDESLIVGFGKSRVALATRAVPVLAAIKAPHIEPEIDALADSKFLELLMIVDRKHDLLSGCAIELLLDEFPVDLDDFGSGWPGGLEIFSELQFGSDIIPVESLFQILLKFV